METNEYTINLNDVPAVEENVQFEEVHDEEYEWECQGGQKLDRSGNVVDKYYKREVPVELEGCYANDQEQEKSFGANKPWLGAIVAPSGDVKIDKKVPSQKLAIEYVYGYRAIDSRNNIFYTAKGNEIVYMTAAIGVVLNTDTNEQRFFGGVERSEGANFHDDDITALAIHPSRTIVATGQVGKNPSICIWNTADCSLITKFKLGADTRAVKCLGFSNSGKFLAAVGDDNDHTVCAWDWESGKKIATTRSGPEAVLDLNFCSTQDNLFATVGKRGVSFWTIGSGTLTQKKGIFGSKKASDMYCCEWLSNGKCITGALNGSIYVWDGQTCSKVIPAHKGLVSTISAIPGGVVTGGKDNVLVIYTEDFKEIRRLQVSALPKALDQNGNGNFVVGLRDGTIVEFVGGHTPKRLMLSHSDGELWGLTVCPKTGCILTTADDNRVMVWDPSRHQCVNGAFINATPGPKPKTMGASTLSAFPPNQCARSVAINHVTGHIAIGVNNGELSIRAAINQLDHIIATKHDAKEWIEAIQYSPDGKYLAVGSHDNVIYIYNSEYKLISKCKKHSSFITSIDWSVDSKHIQAVDGAYELLFFDAHSGSQETSGASALRDEKWATWTSRIGWPVQGIYPSGVDGSHINGVDRSRSGDLVATGDDWRLVNLMKYPCLKGGKPVSYQGHSEHVVRVAFDLKDQYLFTIGGYDRTLIQWRVL